jgi:DeoR/GlpR family transcriptional regulator of sugar metabolism
MKRTGPKERKKKIVSILKERKKIPVSELEDVLKVPASTIRRDLRELVQEGLVIRSHGSVELKKSSASLIPEPAENVDGVLIDCYIAGTAKTLSDDQFIFAGAGCMSEEIARALKDREVVTNSLGVAIAAAPGNTVKLIGETLDRHTFTLGTRDWHPFLKDRIFETVVLEAEGFDERFFYASEDHFWLLKELLAQARKTVLLCRSARFGKANSRRLEYLPNVCLVLTDLEEFEDMVKGKPHWDGIDVVNVHTYAPAEKETSEAPEDGQDITDHEESARTHGQKNHEESLAEVVGNVVFPAKERWSEGKHD